MKIGALQKNIKRILIDCCGIKAAENVLILSDVEEDPIIYNSFYEAAAEAGAKATIMIMPVSLPGKELPDMVNAAAMAADLIITPTTKSVYHAPGIRRACIDGKARLQALSECCVDTFVNGGINADFKKIAPIVAMVGEKYNKGNKIHYTTPGGTDITADISGRKAYLNDGICKEKGTLMGLPTIEVFIAPNEESVEGTICCDLSCSGGIGKINEPITIKVQRGRAVEFSGGEEMRKLKAILGKEKTETVYQIAELAVGLNPKCNITGIINEDEGKYGTCHMALGSNASFGGRNPAPVHIDMVQNLPTITIDGEEIVKDGKLTFVNFEDILKKG